MSRTRSIGDLAEGPSGLLTLSFPPFGRSGRYAGTAGPLKVRPAIFDHFRPIWTILTIFLPLFTILAEFELFWTIFGDFDQFWQFQPFLPFLPFFTILDHFGPFWTIWNHLEPFWTIFTIFTIFRPFLTHFDTSGSMLPRLVPEISPLYAFCDVVGVGVVVEVVVVGIGDSRSWILG